MENFKCYEIHRANMPQFGCTIQCTDCEKKEILQKANGNPGYDEDGAPLPGSGARHVERTGIPFPSVAKAQAKKKELFTKDEMFLFAGYCIGARARNPGISASEMFDEFLEMFKP